MAGREDVFQNAMSMGHSAAWDQQWDQAASFYHQALEEFPDHTGALNNLGLALFELKEYQESFACYLRANKLNPEDPLPVEKIAQIYKQVGKPEQAQAAAMKAAEMHLKNRDAQKAIDNWRFITSLNPHSVQAHTRLALVYERSGHKEEAVKELLILGGLFQRANQMEKAYQAVNYALQLMPGYAPTLDALAMLKDRKSLPVPSQPTPARPPVMLDDIRQLGIPETDDSETKLDPVSETVQLALSKLAEMLFENTEIKQAKQTPRKGIQSIVRGTDNQLASQSDTARIDYYLSQLIDLQSRGEIVLASKELERAMDAGLDHPAAYFDMGWLHNQNGRQESALRMLQHAVNHPEYAMAGRLLAARILRQLGKVKEGSIQYVKALSLADASVLSEFQANDLLQIYDPLIEAQSQVDDLGYHEKVCENIEQLLNRNNWRAHIANARQQLDSQADGNNLIPLAEVILQARSSQVVESLSRVNELAQAGHLRSAMEEAFYALQYAPTYLPIHARMGEILLKQEQNQEAIEKFITVAKSYSSRGEARRAIDYYRRVIEIAPYDLSPRHQLTTLLISAGQIEEAVQEQMDLAEVYYNLADLENSRKTYAEAIRLTQQNNLDRAWTVKILHRLADLSLQSLDWRQGLKAYEQICMLSPTDEKARASMVEINYRLGQQSKAIAELDNYLNYLNNQGQREKILGFLEYLANEAPGIIPVRHRLADQYRRLGRVEDAVVQLAAITDLHLQAGDKDNAIKTIEEILAMKPADVSKYQQTLFQIKMGGSKAAES
ncbi:MAG: hypothetical protein A2W33_02550 [Chloroflexi bacterium RBG_16_52_11]|nr:MAG: hypothetical protein A2W33_02550 [Chloroflexi bacterium RBG_16_52_11]